MQAEESLAKTAVDNGGDVSSASLIPGGGFAITLMVRLRTGVSVQDGKAVLSEYARKTCAESGILRCDVLYEVSPRRIAKGTLYEIWILFESSQAYIDHEKTSHAAKLRLWLENPTGGDNAVALTRLSYKSSVFEPLLPDLKGWKSGIDYDLEENDKENERIAAAALSMLSGKKPQVSGALRKSLDVLASNVGLENVTILIASATASSKEVMPSLIGLCEDYAQNQEAFASVVRTGVLVERHDPLRILVLTVHDAESEEGAFFETDLAVDFIDGDWTVKRYLSVFPDKLGWERSGTDSGKAVANEAQTFLGPTSTPSIAENRPEAVNIQNVAPSQTGQQYRLVQGADALDMIKKVIRDMTRKPKGNIKVMIITSWNASRSSPILNYMRPAEDESIPRQILFKYGLSVRTCEATTSLLSKGVQFARDYNADCIIGYGGGAVMDMAQAVGMLGYASENHLEGCIDKINRASREGKSRIAVEVPPSAIPVLLIPSNVGFGSEFADLCVFVGESDDGGSRRLAVDFVDPPNAVRFRTDKTILRDTRLISPRCLRGFHAAQGALAIICHGMETIMSVYEQPGSQAVKLAEDSISEASETFTMALREPEKATGQSRDPLAEAHTKVGIAADFAGRIGICSRISLAVADHLLDGTVPFCFRMIMIRISASVVDEMCSWGESHDAAYVLGKIAEALQVNNPADIAVRLLACAEDSDVYSLREVGLVRRLLPRIAADVLNTLAQEECSPLEHMFTNQAVLKRILTGAMDQQFEL